MLLFAPPPDSTTSTTSKRAWLYDPSWWWVLLGRVALQLLGRPVPSSLPGRFGCTRWPKRNHLKFMVDQKYQQHENTCCKNVVSYEGHEWWVLKNWRIDSKRNGWPYVCLRCCRLGDLHKAGGCLQATGFHTRMLHNHSPDLCRQASSQPAFGGTSKWLHQALQCEWHMNGQFKTLQLVGCPIRILILPFDFMYEQKISEAGPHQEQGLLEEHTNHIGSSSAVPWVSLVPGLRGRVACCWKWYNGMLAATSAKVKRCPTRKTSSQEFLFQRRKSLLSFMFFIFYLMSWFLIAFDFSLSFFLDLNYSLKLPSCSPAIFSAKTTHALIQVLF